MAFWWLGINNATRRPRDTRIVFLSDIEAFLKGETANFEWEARGREWPFKRDRAYQGSLYEQMSRGDQVLLWLGPRTGKDWGIIGKCRVLDPRRDAITLHDYVRFQSPISVETAAGVFPANFGPLALRENGARRSITVAELHYAWYERILEVANVGRSAQVS
jgi:hypothetical protein